MGNSTSVLRALKCPSSGMDCCAVASLNRGQSCAQPTAPMPIFTQTIWCHPDLETSGPNGADLRGATIRALASLRAILVAADLRGVSPIGEGRTVHALMELDMSLVAAEEQRSDRQRLRRLDAFPAHSIPQGRGMYILTEWVGWTTKEKTKKKSGLSAGNGNSHYSASRARQTGWLCVSAEQIVVKYT